MQIQYVPCSGSYFGSLIFQDTIDSGKDTIHKASLNRSLHASAKNPVQSAAGDICCILVTLFHLSFFLSTDNCVIMADMPGK